MRDLQALNPRSLAAKLNAARLQRKMSNAQDLNPERYMTRRFLELAFRHQMSIALELDLVEDTDRMLADSEFFVALFARAAKGRKLGRLWAAIETRYGADISTGNPFVGR